MRAKILASGLISSRKRGDDHAVVILDEGACTARPGSRFTVGPAGAPANGCARLKLIAEGWLPLARVERLQTDVSLEDLKGMEAVRRG